MKQGTRLICSDMGFLDNGKPIHPACAEEIKFDQFTESGKKVQIIGITKEGYIKSTIPECCKLVNPDEYFDKKPENPLLS